MKLSHIPVPGTGIVKDVRGRLPWYKQDWKDGINCGIRILAPAVYIFFASVIPALAFGEQFALDTDGVFTAVQVLFATVMANAVQSIIGGQPLLIVGVAEPIVLLYKFMYDFAKDKEDIGRELFLAWAAWVCVWAGLMCLALSLANTCAFIDRFTRFSGELFGMLIAALFLQQAVKGLVSEFRAQDEVAGITDSSEESQEEGWLRVNGLWSIIIAFGLLFSCLVVVHARDWRFLRSWLRGGLADYGVPLLVLLWSLLGYVVDGPKGVPRTISLPNTWSDVATRTWSTAADMGRVPGAWIAGGLLPGLLITLLFYFDHNVSSQMAQQPEYNLTRPPAYHYDMLLLGLMTAGWGLLGLPPINGVLPQAPLHTRKLASLEMRLRQKARRALAVAARAGESGGGAAAAAADGQPGATGRQDSTPAKLAAAAANGGAVALQPLGAPPVTNGTPRSNSAADGTSAPGAAEDAAANGVPKSGSDASLSTRADPVVDAAAAAAAVPAEQPLPAAVAADMAFGSDRARLVEAAVAAGEGAELEWAVREQRVTNLVQSMLIGVCLAATPALRFMPSSVLWGYFAYMAIESLEGSEFWHRTLLLITDPKHRRAMLLREHPAYMETVPFRVLVAFTLFQLLYLGAVYGLTWAGVAGILFPVPILALIPVRQYVLPRVMDAAHLRELDAAAYEEAGPVSAEEAAREAAAQGLAPPVDAGEEAAEEDALQGEVVGWRRGEIKHHLTHEEVVRRAAESHHSETTSSRGGAGGRRSSDGLPL